jgi:hypothetical protein
MNSGDLTSQLLIASDREHLKLPCETLLGHPVSARGRAAAVLPFFSILTFFNYYSRNELAKHFLKILLFLVTPVHLA